MTSAVIVRVWKSVELRAVEHIGTHGFMCKFAKWAKCVLFVEQLRRSHWEGRASRMWVVRTTTPGARTACVGVDRATARTGEPVVSRGSRLLLYSASHSLSQSVSQSFSQIKLPRN